MEKLRIEPAPVIPPHSSMLGVVQKILAQRGKIRTLTDMAFSAIDTDNNGYLDRIELKDTLREIAKEIGIPVPSENDVLIVLYELDQNDDD